MTFSSLSFSLHATSFAAALLIACSAATLARAEKPAAGQGRGLALWYDAPAERWTEALPIGNGRLGAMIFGGIAEERLQLNEDTLWTGGPHCYDHPGAAETLPELRQLLFAGRQREAEALAMERFMSIPLRQRAYQPLGNLKLEFPGHANAVKYRRQLDLDAAIATTEYEVDGVRYQREVFASHPARAIIVTLSCDRAGRLSFTTSLDSPQTDLKFSEVRVGASSKPSLRLTGRVRDQVDQTGAPVPGKMKFAANATLLATDGDAAIDARALSVSNATHATLLVTAATNFVNFQDISADPIERSDHDAEQAANHSLETLRSDHLADYQPLFRRVALQLGPPTCKASGMINSNRRGTASIRRTSILK